MNVRFLLIGEEGAVQFLLYTGWVPFYEKTSSIGYRMIPDKLTKTTTMPADLGYHSKEQMYEGQQQMDCEYVEGGKCYYDGSGLNAYNAFYALVNGGEKGLWEFLEGYYNCTFKNGDYLEPTEYFKPRRTNQ